MGIVAMRCLDLRILIGRGGLPYKVLAALPTTGLPAPVSALQDAITTARHIASFAP